MRRWLLLGLAPGLLSAQSPATPAPAIAPDTSGRSASGRWIVDTDFYGTPIYWAMELAQQGEKLSGNFSGDKLEGTVSGDAVRFLARDDQGGTEECRCTLRGCILSGTIIFIDAGDETHPSPRTFTARRVPERRAGSPRRHEFAPTAFSRQFSALNKPVLTI